MMGLSFICKLEFANTWKSIVAEKIADLAQVKQVTESTFCDKDGTRSFETDDLSNYAFVTDGDMICITYDGGYIVLFGWLSTLSEGGEDILLIRLEYYKTTNKKKHKAVLDRIADILNDMAYEFPEVPRYWTRKRMVICFFILLLIALMFAIFMAFSGFADKPAKTKTSKKSVMNVVGDFSASSAITPTPL